MGRWDLTDPELLKALDEDPELVRMVEDLAAVNGETPNELVSRALNEGVVNDSRGEVRGDRR